MYGLSGTVRPVMWLSAIGITLTTCLLLVSTASIVGSVGKRKWPFILSIILLAVEYVELLAYLVLP